MPELTYGVSSFERRRGDLPSLPVVNMLAENIPNEPGITLQSRPGLVYSAITLGPNSVDGLFLEDGVLGGGLFGVSGGSLYSSNVALGAINGTGPISFGGWETNVFVNAGQSIWNYDGSTLSQITFPDGANVSKILVAGSRIVALRSGTAQFYWSDVLSTNIDSLSFATAENSADLLLDMVFVGDRLMLFGKETVETWPITGDNDLPFAPLVGTVFPVGIKTTGCATEFARTFAWITNHNEVCVQDPDNIISEPELQIRIQKSSSTSLWTFYVDNNEYLAVSIDNETWVYGARSQVWSVLESYNQPNWLGQCYAGGYFGLRNAGTLAQWSDNDSYLDLGGIMRRQFSGWAPITAGSLVVSNIILRTNPGTTPFLSGDYASPVVELRTSDDGGREWLPWISNTLGEQGLYRTKTIWSSLGQFGYPGLLVQIRCTDPVPFRISGLAYNEPFGGK